MFRRPPPIHQLPADYEEVYHLHVMDTDKLLWLNVLSIGLLIPFVLGMAGWSSFVQSIRGSFAVTQPVPDFFLILLALMVLPLHEWLHGIAIRWAGHRPRYGMHGVRIGRVTIPYVLFATADGAYFPRDAL